MGAPTATDDGAWWRRVTTGDGRRLANAGGWEGRGTTCHNGPVRSNAPHWYSGSGGTPPRRPARLDPEVADAIEGAPDPAEANEIAHATAWAFVDGARENASEATPERVELLRRLVRFGESEGIETVAEMWADADAMTLPGALWRMYAIREWVHRDGQTITDAYRRGLASDDVAEVIAGIAPAPEPRDVSRTVDTMLAGLFDGDLDVALDRASALLKILAAGVKENALSFEATDTTRSHLASTRASALGRTADELSSAARLARAGALE